MDDHYLAAEALEAWKTSGLMRPFIIRLTGSIIRNKNFCNDLIMQWKERVGLMNCNVFLLLPRDDVKDTKKVRANAIASFLIKFQKQIRKPVVFLGFSASSNCRERKLARCIFYELKVKHSDELKRSDISCFDLVSFPCGQPLDYFFFADKVAPSWLVLLHYVLSRYCVHRCIVR